METPTTANTEKEQFNALVKDDYENGKKIEPYTWIYRWEDPTEFDLRLDENYIHRAGAVIGLREERDQHRYLKNILQNRSYIIIYHEAGPSRAS